MPEQSEISFLHQRYQQQAGWTASIREYLFSQLQLPESARILEVGCGTGAIMEQISTYFPNSLCAGIDLDWESIAFAKTQHPSIDYAHSNALNLPFSTNTFDLVVCHFFLLWATPLEAILNEIRRITKSHSPFLVLAEPDYGGRIDFPVELQPLGMLQEQTLQQQGANTRIGRELPSHLQKAGFTDVATGILGGEWNKETLNENLETDVLIRDLSDSIAVDTQELEKLIQLDQQSRGNGTRILFVPTFYARGTKK